MIGAVAALLAATALGHGGFAGISPDGRPAARASAGAAVPYGGGPVLHSNRTRLIFWAPAGSGLAFAPGYEALIERFLRDVAADNHSSASVYGLSGQYTDAVGPAAYDSRYAGAVVDSDPLPASGCTEPPPPPQGTGPGWSDCLTAAQLEAEVAHVLAARGLPRGTGDVYFLVMPDGLGSCESAGPSQCALGGPDNGGYCAYHTIADGVPYAVIPYTALPGHCQSQQPRPNASPADPTISALSHEHIEMVTDPFGNAWVGSGGQEVGDLCVAMFGPAVGGSGSGAWNQVIDRHHYFLQDEWSNAAGSCQARAPADKVSFRLVGDRLVARVVRHPIAIRSFDWFFGRKRGGHGRRVLARPGRYRVALRAVDAWGSWARYARRVRVAT